MHRAALLVLLVVSAACGDSAPTSTEPTTTAPPAPQPAPSTTTQTASSTTTLPPTTTATTATTIAPTTSTAPTTSSAPGAGRPAIRIDLIAFAGDPYLLLANRGDGPGSTEGLFICRFPDYFALPSIDLQPGERLAIPLGDGEVPPLVGVVATLDVQSPVGPITAAEGEIGLYNRNAFNSPQAIVDYVEWGAPRHARSGVAVAAGIWVEDGFVAVPDELLAIVAETFPTAGPDDWFAEIGG